MALIMLIIMNLAVMATIYISIFLLGHFAGIDITQLGSLNTLFLYSMIIGFSGAFISLLLSKWMAKRAMGVTVIETPSNETEQWLVDTVAKLAKDAGIGMPEVGYFGGSPNAFATGWNRNNALVAVSTSLFDFMDAKEIEGVLAHEISHIKNGDMITMTLMQGVLNTFVVFISRLIASAFARDKDGNLNYFAYSSISFVLDLVLSVLASIVLMAYSRHREYKADEGAVKLSGAEGIYNALAKLGQIPKEQAALPESMKAFGIVGFLGIFSSHPPIEKRLEHIEEIAKQRI